MLRLIYGLFHPCVESTNSDSYMQFALILELICSYKRSLVLCLNSKFFFHIVYAAENFNSPIIGSSDPLGNVTQMREGYNFSECKYS